MGFRLQQRIGLVKGLGLNLSGSGASLSARTKYGSIGPRGFSLRTGIPGLTYRSGFSSSSRRSGKGSDTLVILLLALTFGVLVAIIWNMLRFGFWAIMEVIKWILRMFIKPKSVIE
jgi:hypothetical protein